MDVVTESLAPIQKCFREIRESRELLDTLREGAEKAGAIAEKTMRRVKDKFGLGF